VACVVISAQGAERRGGRALATGSVYCQLILRLGKAHHLLAKPRLAVKPRIRKISRSLEQMAFWSSGAKSCKVKIKKWHLRFRPIHLLHIFVLHLFLLCALLVIFPLKFQLFGLRKRISHYCFEVNNGSPLAMKRRNIHVLANDHRQS
jgi:hypothetical protein